MTDNEIANPEPAASPLGAEEDLSRGEVFLKAAIAAFGIYGLGAVGPYVRAALAADAGGDVHILNFLLPFEYLQVSLYNRGNSETNTTGGKMALKPREKELTETFLAEEGEHVKALRDMIVHLGGKPVKKGNYAFAYRVFTQFLELAGKLETAAIGAYNGAIPSLKSKEARELAFSIVQVEARHAATARIGIREDPAPEPFDKGESEQNSINAVLPFTGVFG
jgi:rubrerythrin